MAQLTKRLSLVVTLWFLGTVGVAQVTPGNPTSSATPHGNATSSAKPHSNATPTKTVPLQCDGDSGDIHVGSKPVTINFAPPATCPLQSFQFTNNAPGLTLIGTSPDGSIWYYYDGTPIPSAGYPFRYITKAPQPTGGNGTGVIKH